MKAKELWKEMTTDEKRTYKQQEGKKSDEGSKRTAFHYFINYYYQEMEQQQPGLSRNEYIANLSHIWEQMTPQQKEPFQQMA